MKKKNLKHRVCCVSFIAGCVALGGGCRSVEPRSKPAQAGAPQENELEKRQLEPVEPSSLPVVHLEALADYLKYAALNNPGLEAAFNRWKAALERIPQVTALPDPKFNYAYYIREVETRVGPQNQKFGIGQTFPWFGTLSLRGDQAGEAAHAARELYEAEKLQLFYEVKELFYEYYYLRRAIEITEENIGLLKTLESVAQTKFRAGSDVGGVVKAQVEIGKLEDQLNSLHDLRRPIVGQLAAALNLPVETPLPWPSDVELSDVSMNDAELFEALAGSNPELKALAHKVAEEGRAIELAKKEFYPDLTLGVDYIETGEAKNRSVSDSGEDPVVAMFSINIPLWYGKYRAGLREAERRRAAAEMMQVNRENLLESQLKMALYKFRDASRKATLYQDTLTPLAKSSLGVAQQSYEGGKADFLELIDAQRLLLEFQLAYERALSDREQRLAQIEMLVGREFNPLRIQ